MTDRKFKSPLEIRGISAIANDSVLVVERVIGGWVPDRFLPANDPENLDAIISALENNVQFLENLLEDSTHTADLDIEALSEIVAAGRIYLNEILGGQ